MVKRDFIRNIIIALIAIFVLVLLRVFVFSTFRVHDDAVNSYLSNGDVVVVNRNRQPQYKDFVVYEEDGTFYISRVIATPGQTATVMDDILYIDNVAKEEPYISQMKSKYTASSDSQMPFTSDFSIETLTDNKETQIPKGSYLVLNDDRQNTNDSRKFGLIKAKQIRGVVTFKLWPLSQLGFLTPQQFSYSVFLLSLILW